MKKILRNQMGMSLMEVMIATAIMGAMAMGFLKMMENQTKSMNYIDARNSEAEMKRTAQLYLSNRDACTQSLQFMNAVSSDYTFVAADGIKDKLGTKIMELGSKLGVGGADIEITSIVLSNRDVPTGAPVPPLVTKTGSMELTITTNRLKKLQGSPTKISKILIAVKVDASDAIMECSEASDKLDATLFCIDNDCRTTYGEAEGQCGANEVVLRINKSGSVDCANLQCPAGQVMYGLDTNVGVDGDKLRARAMCRVP